MSLVRFFAACAVAGAAAAGSAQAAPVSAGVWYDFLFQDVGDPFQDGSGSVNFTNPASVDAPAPAWTFTLTNMGSLTFQDGFSSGDQFEIFNFGASLGITSAPTSGADCENDLSCAIADDDFSRAVFALGPGSYSITGAPTLSPFGGGAGAFIVNQVPLPAASVLLVAAIGGLAAVGRARAV